MPDVIFALVIDASRMCHIKCNYLALVFYEIGMGSCIKQIFEFLQWDFSNSFNELIIQSANLGQVFFFHLFNYDFEILWSCFYLLSWLFYFNFLGHELLSHSVFSTRMIGFFVVFFKLHISSKLSATEFALTDLSVVGLSLMGQKSFKWFEFLSASHTIIATLCGEWGLFLLP